MTKRPSMKQPKPASAPAPKPSPDTGPRASDIRRVLGEPGASVGGTADTSLTFGHPRGWLRHF